MSINQPTGIAAARAGCVTNYDALVVETPWYIAILGLPLRLLLPVLLMVILTRSREVRIAFGASFASY